MKQTSKSPLSSLSLFIMIVTIKANSYLDSLEESRDLSRFLVHIDMDAFFANVEIRDNPYLADKPMAVGSDSMLVLMLFN
jgi:hypothetical protein